MIQMFHVTKSYPGDPPVLSDINLHIRKGEFVFLTGPSGAGKTTLLKLILCAERPTKGQILIAGKNVARIKESSIPYLRRNIGVVFQDFKLLPNQTVFENVAYALDVLGIPRREARERVNKILKTVSLLHRADLFPPRLSGGEQQRLVIARALVNDPTIVLADEPTGNLDPALTLEIMDLLHDVNIRGTTMIVATHDHSLLSRYRKRTLCLERGKIVDREEFTPARRLVAG